MNTVVLKRTTAVISGSCRHVPAIRAAGRAQGARRFTGDPVWWPKWHFFL